MPIADTAVTVQLLFSTTRNNVPMNSTVVKLNPKDSTNTVNPSMQQNVKRIGLQGIRSFDNFSCIFFVIQVLKKMIMARHPITSPDRKGKKPAPGLEKVPKLNPTLFKQM